MTTYVGTRAPRVDSVEKVTGSAIYGVDVALPGMLHGAVLRSPHPHARIVSIDTTAAAAAPGVEVVVTGRDFPLLFGAAIKDQPFLAIDRVRYVGEPVVAVAATSEAAGAGGARSDPRRLRRASRRSSTCGSLSSDDAPLVHPDLHAYERGPSDIVPHTNINTIYRYERGDVEAGFAAADLVIEGEYSAHAISHVALEVHAAIAQYDSGSGGYTLWVSTDRPFLLRNELAGGLGVDSSRSPVDRCPGGRVVRRQGCAGGRSCGRCAGTAQWRPSRSRRVHPRGRPRRVPARVPAIMKLKTGVNRDGLMLARSAEVLWDSGAYTAYTVGVAIRGSQTIVGPYRIPDLKILSRQVYTNKAITGSYRGYGTTQVTWACETQMDEIAVELGLDPVAFRLQNGYEEGDSYLNGQIMHGVGLARDDREDGRRDRLGSGRA